MVWKVNPRAKFFSYGGGAIAATCVCLCAYSLGSMARAKSD